MLTKTTYEHIILDESAAPQIAGANTKVVELVLDHIAYGWSPEELRLQHPHLTLGQIYSALAYYWDHQTELDQDIERRLHDVTVMRRAAGETRLEKRLRAQGLI
jgi:uncharacterized protein (DUF433 family)